jgi:hypothetical protein
MKTITINILSELKVWLTVFLITNVLNVAAILIYKTEWKELYTQLGFVFMMSLFLYVLVALVRFIVSLFRKKKN